MLDSKGQLTNSKDTHMLTRGDDVFLHDRDSGSDGVNLIQHGGHALWEGRGGEGRGEFFHCLNKSAKCEGVLCFDFAKSHPRLFHSYLHTIPSTAASGP